MIASTQWQSFSIQQESTEVNQHASNSGIFSHQWVGDYLYSWSVRDGEHNLTCCPVARSKRVTRNTSQVNVSMQEPVFLLSRGGKFIKYRFGHRFMLSSAMKTRSENLFLGIPQKLVLFLPIVKSLLQNRKWPPFLIHLTTNVYRPLPSDLFSHLGQFQNLGDLPSFARLLAVSAMASKEGVTQNHQQKVT